MTLHTAYTAKVKSKEALANALEFEGYAAHLEEEIGKAVLQGQLSLKYETYAGKSYIDKIERILLGVGYGVSIQTEKFGLTILHISWDK